MFGERRLRFANLSGGGGYARTEMMQCFMLQIPDALTNYLEAKLVQLETCHVQAWEPTTVKILRCRRDWLQQSAYNRARHGAGWRRGERGQQALWTIEFEPSTFGRTASQTSDNTFRYNECLFCKTMHASSSD